MTILEGIGVFLMGIGATQVLAWLFEGGRGLWRRSQPVEPTTENTSTSGQVARYVIPELRQQTVLWPNREYAGLTSFYALLDRYKINPPNPTPQHAEVLQRLLTLLEEGSPESLAEARELSPFERAHLLN